MGLTPAAIAKAAARLVGMHTFDEIAALMDGVEPGLIGAAKLIYPLARGQGDNAEIEIAGSAAIVRQTT